MRDFREAPHSTERVQSYKLFREQPNISAIICIKIVLFSFWRQQTGIFFLVEQQLDGFFRLGVIAQIVLYGSCLEIVCCHYVALDYLLYRLLVMFKVSCHVVLEFLAQGGKLFLGVFIISLKLGKFLKFVSDFSVTGS